MTNSTELTIDIITNIQQIRGEDDYSVYHECEKARGIIHQHILSLNDLKAAAQAVIDRWDSPAWKDLPHTADYIHRLRKALGVIGSEYSAVKKDA